MARPRGTRNPDFERHRQELLDAARAYLAVSDGTFVSFRQLAAAAGVSVSTLRHYFNDRDGLLRALMRLEHQRGMPYMQRVMAAELLPLQESIRWILEFLVSGFGGTRLNKTHSIGIGVGMGSASLGPVYLAEILEPTLQSIETRLLRHSEAGHLRPVDLRHAALSLIAPMLLGLLHQHELGGHTYRPLDARAFIDDQVEAFVRAYGSEKVPGHQARPTGGKRASARRKG